MTLLNLNLSCYNSHNWNLVRCSTSGLKIDNSDELYVSDVLHGAAIVAF